MWVAITPMEWSLVPLQVMWVAITPMEWLLVPLPSHEGQHYTHGMVTPRYSTFRYKSQGSQLHSWYGYSSRSKSQGSQLHSRYGTFRSKSQGSQLQSWYGYSSRYKSQGSQLHSYGYSSVPLEVMRVAITPMVWLLVCPATSHVGQNDTHDLVPWLSCHKS